jgi:hypothetical protein
LLGLLAIPIALTVGVECVLPMTQASAMAPELSRRFGLPREAVEEELYVLLNEGLGRRIAVRTGPLLALGVWVAVRVAKGRQREGSEPSR